MKTLHRTKAPTPHEHARGGGALAWTLRAAFVASTALLGVALLIPPHWVNALRPDGVDSVDDSLQHAIGFATVCALGIAAFRARAVMIGVALFGFGLALEGAQAAMAMGRTADPADALANAAGIALALTLGAVGAAAWRWRRAQLPANAESSPRRSAITPEKSF